MLHPIFLAVNLQEWAEGIFFLIMGVLWLINRVATVIETARRPPPAVRRPPQAMPAQGGEGPQVQAMQPRQLVQPQGVGPQGQPRPGGDALQGEIEEFLRRASGRREGPQKPGQGQRARPVAARAAPTGYKVDPRRARPAPPIVRAKPAPSAPVESADTPEAISQHVKQYLDMRDFDQRTTNLSSIDEKEKQFEQKLQQTFSHELGHLKRSTLADGGDAAATAVQPVAPQNPNILAGLFRSGVDLKRAIALNEIFQRPEHRW